jgi:hypothetical protein
MGRVKPELSFLYDFYQTWSKQETLLATPETLPTTEPTDPQVSYTVASEDLPVFTFPPKKKVYTAQVVVAGRFVTAGTVYYMMLKNGNTVIAGSGSVSANYYWTWNCGFYDVAVGDVLAVKLWSSVTDSDWRHKGMTVMATRVAPFLDRVYRNILYSLNLAPAYTLGNPSGVNQGLRVIGMDTASYWDNIVADKTYEVQYPKSTYGLYRLGTGDYTENNSAYLRTSSTYYPTYNRNYYPNFHFRLLERWL